MNDSGNSRKKIVNGKFTGFGGDPVRRCCGREGVSRGISFQFLLMDLADDSDDPRAEHSKCARQFLPVFF